MNSELTEEDWTWLEKLAAISQQDVASRIPPETRDRLTSAGYTKVSKGGRFAITEKGRQAWKDRTGGS